MTPTTLRTTAALFLFSLLTFAALTPQDPQNAQAVSRFALTLSIVERGTIEISPFAPYTIDKSAYGTRRYTDKPPGHPFLAVPGAVAAQRLFGPLGDSVDPSTASFRRHIAATTVLTNGVISAAAVVMLFLVALRLGATREGALFGAVSLAAATPFLGWSTAFFAHSVTASMLAFGFGWIVIAFTGPPPRPRPVPAAALLGLLLGYTLVVDLTAAPLVAVAGLCALAAARQKPWREAAATAAALAGGGAIGLAPLLAYNQFAFDSPFRLGYAAVVGFEGMRTGFFGIAWPDPEVALELVFGLYRGLLPVSPVLALVPLGVWRLWRRRELRPAAAVIVLAFAIHLCINAGYHYWDGGWSTGPRHMTAALPFLAMALAFAWPNRMRGVSLALLAVSAAISLACAAASMFSPEDVGFPLLEYVLPNLLRPGVPVRLAVALAIWAVALLVWQRSAARSARPSIA
ncbi:MAG: hypothetical protein AB7K86_21615 [Rhodospirillales bacterium]